MTEPNISPLARRLAEENNVEWRSLYGSGAEGKVVERDVLDYLARVMAGEEALNPTPEPVPEGMEAWPDEDVALAATDPSASSHNLEGLQRGLAASSRPASGGYAQVEENEPLAAAEVDSDDAISEDIFLFDDDDADVDSAGADAEDVYEEFEEDALLLTGGDGAAATAEPVGAAAEVDPEEAGPDVFGDGFFNDGDGGGDEDDGRDVDRVEASSPAFEGAEARAGSGIAEGDADIDPVLSGEFEIPDYDQREAPELFLGADAGTVPFDDPGEDDSEDLNAMLASDPVLDTDAAPELLVDADAEVHLDSDPMPDAYDAYDGDDVDEAWLDDLGDGDEEEPLFAAEPEIEGVVAEVHDDAVDAVDEGIDGPIDLEPRAAVATDAFGDSDASHDDDGYAVEHDEPHEDDGEDLIEDAIAAIAASESESDFVDPEDGGSEEEPEPVFSANVPEDMSEDMAEDEDEQAALEPVAITPEVAALVVDESGDADADVEVVPDLPLVSYGNLLRRHHDLSALAEAQLAVARELGEQDPIAPSAFLLRAAAKALAAEPLPAGSSVAVAVTGGGFGVRAVPDALRRPFVNLLELTRDASGLSPTIDGVALVVADMSALEVDEAVLDVGAPVLTLGRILYDNQRGSYRSTLSLSGRIAPDVGARLLARVAELLDAPVRLVI